MIKEFKGKYRFLSNFWYETIFFGGVEFPTVEHAFQAAKTDSREEIEEICNAKTPGVAKKLGRKVGLTPYWEQKKRAVMWILLWDKFSWQDTSKMLLATGDQELIEGNYWHDNYWGDCFCKKCEEIPGQNHLGKMLMKIREELKNEST